MKPNKVVFDTNIWVSFYLKARFSQLIELVLERDLTLISSPTLVAELSEVLSRAKFSRYLDLPVQEYIDFHLNLVQIVETQPLFSQSPDPKDNFLFDLALQSEALLIVTGDKRLLEVSPMAEVKLISLAEFLSHI